MVNTDEYWISRMMSGRKDKRNYRNLTGLLPCFLFARFLAGVSVYDGDNIFNRKGNKAI